MKRLFKRLFGLFLSVLSPDDLRKIHAPAAALRDASKRLRFAAGMAVFAASCTGFALLVAETVNRAQPPRFDLHVSQWLHERASPFFTESMFAATALGSGPIVAGVTVVCVAALARCREWFWLGALLLATAGGGVLITLMKQLFHRERPVLFSLAGPLSDYSFPSGHTMEASLLYGWIALFFALRVKRTCWGTATIWVSALTVLLVALSRVYLGVHYATDVLGGITAGSAWLLVCLAAADGLRRSFERD